MIRVRISIPLITKNILIPVLILIAFYPCKSVATNDPVIATKSYVNWYAEHAIEQMVKFRIPASVILAQAIFESNCGQSALAQKSNNHFGIKCHLEWGGDTVVKTDDTLNECFRKYNSVEDSYTDHSMFLKSRARYSFLFELSVTDYKGWCKGLKQAGYATFPGYAEKLIEIIEENQLYKYDTYEKVDKKIQINTKDQIVGSKFKTGLFSLKDLVKCEALFVNERDMLIQSLQLQNGPESAESDEIAGK
jgi:hypothetical protein